MLAPESWSPPWSWVSALAVRVPATGAKVAPGIDHGALPAGTQTEWISVGGDLVEAGVWWGPLREGAASRRATVLTTRTTADWSHPEPPEEESLDDVGGIPEPSVGAVSAWLDRARSGRDPRRARVRAGGAHERAPARPPDRLHRLRHRAHRREAGLDLRRRRRGAVRAQADARLAAHPRIRRRHRQEARDQRRPRGAARGPAPHRERTDRDPGAHAHRCRPVGPAGGAQNGQVRLPSRRNPAPSGTRNPPNNPGHPAEPTGSAWPAGGAPDAAPSVAAAVAPGLGATGIRWRTRLTVNSARSPRARSIRPAPSSPERPTELDGDVVAVLGARVDDQGVLPRGDGTDHDLRRLLGTRLG